MMGTYKRPSRERIQKRLTWAVERLGAEAERLERCVDQRDHLIATIITNLRHGATPEQVLAWWDEHGRKSRDGGREG